MIRKNVRWKRNNFNILIFGTLFVIALLILLIPEMRNQRYAYTGPLVSQEIANENASEIIAALVEEGQLDDSWGFIPASSVKKIVFKGNREWGVVFVNKLITDPARQKLYVFLTLSGEHLAVNYSGN